MGSGGVSKVCPKCGLREGLHEQGCAEVVYDNSDDLDLAECIAHLPYNHKARIQYRQLTGGDGQTSADVSPPVEPDYEDDVVREIHEAAAEHGRSEGADSGVCPECGKQADQAPDTQGVEGQRPLHREAVNGGAFPSGSWPRGPRPSGPGPNGGPATIQTNRSSWSPRTTSRSGWAFPPTPETRRRQIGYGKVGDWRAKRLICTGAAALNPAQPIENNAEKAHRKPQEADLGFWGIQPPGREADGSGRLRCRSK